MTGFDLVVIGIIVLSALFAFMRGLLREVIALVSWIVALVAAFTFAEPIANAFDTTQTHPIAMQVVAFIAVFAAVLIVGRIIAAATSSAVRAVGLGWLDRLLGAGFGVARGVLAVLVVIIVAGVTNLPRSDWWQNSALAPVFVAAALELKDWLPANWAERLELSGSRPAPRGDGMRVARPLPTET